MSYLNNAPGVAASTGFHLPSETISPQFTDIGAWERDYLDASITAPMNDNASSFAPTTVATATAITQSDIPDVYREADVAIFDILLSFDQVVFVEGNRVAKGGVGKPVNAADRPKNFRSRLVLKFNAAFSGVKYKFYATQGSRSKVELFDATLHLGAAGEVGPVVARFYPRYEPDGKTRPLKKYPFVRGVITNASINAATWNDRAVNNIASLYSAANSGLLYAQVTGTLKKDRLTRGIHYDITNTGLALGRGQLFPHTRVSNLDYESDGQTTVARDSDSDYSDDESQVMPMPAANADMSRRGIPANGAADSANEFGQHSFGAGSASGNGYDTASRRSHYSKSGNSKVFY